uniref:Uncharacterized protein n=1 Tax=Oryza meridionalis TaxID=40149 RepID=A0A0E0EH00_9ORYZ
MERKELALYKEDQQQKGPNGHLELLYQGLMWAEKAKLMVKWAMMRNVLSSVSPQALRQYLMVGKRHRTKKAEQGSMLTFRKRLKWTEVSTGAPIDTTFPTKTQDPTGAL